jgi:hypothetical protein
MIEPCMEKWTSFSPRLGTDSKFNFTANFFAWWRRQIIVIEEFLYAGVDFLGNVDLVLPEDIDWDVSGTKPNLVMCFLFIFYIIFVCTKRDFNICFVSSCR